MWKIALGTAAIGLSLCMVTAATAAKGHPGGHPSGGHSGGVAHFHASTVHMGGSHVTHFGRSHVTHFSRPSYRVSHRGHGENTPRLSHATTPAFNSSDHSFASTVRFDRSHTSLAGDPRTFAARRQFVADGAFRPFFHDGWHPYHHLGWVGPLFWPYAYGDFFYYALWPDYYAYVDPFWVYGYGDIYEGIFSPYTYDEYVQGRGAHVRMTGLTDRMAQSCADEAAEVTGWPIDQIHDAVQPNPQQSALLDDFGNAIVKASDIIKSNCPTTVSFTPTGRLSEMQQRLQGLVQAVDTVSLPLTKFYDSLSDEQKARFNDIGASVSQHAASDRPAANAPSQQTECGASVMAWPTDQVDRAVQPNDMQRAKLDALQSAASKAQDMIKAACPSEPPSTPPTRLEAVNKRLHAMLEAVQTVQPVLADFYNSLSDDQKARFNTVGKRLFAANQE